MLLLVGVAEGGLFGKKKNPDADKEPPMLPPFPETKIPQCIFGPRPAGSEDAVVCLGRVLYPTLNGINTVLRFTTGKPISEFAWVNMFRTICHLTYMAMVMWGFRVLPRSVMIVVGVTTSFIGPVMAFFLIAIWLAPVWFFLTMPVTSMNVMCLAYFLSESMGQRLLQSLGLDQDNDNDVDMIDIGKAIVRKIPGRFGGGVPTPPPPGKDDQQKPHPFHGKISSWLDFVNDGLQDPKHRDVLEKISKLTNQMEKLLEEHKKLLEERLPEKKKETSK